MMRKNLNKKATILLAAMAVTAAVSACGQKTAETTAAASGAETTAAAGEEEIAGAEIDTTESSAALIDTEADRAAIEALNPVRPESLGTIELGDYKGIELEATKAVTITDEDVETFLSYYILPSFVEAVEVAEDGDTVNIDYVGKKDGEAFEGGSAEGYNLKLGSGNFIDGFESGLVGAKKGEKRDLNLTFPEDYQSEDLAGAEVVFEVTVNEIYREKELTDENVKELDPEVSSVAEYKDGVKKILQQNEDMAARQLLAYSGITKVIENSKIEVSEEAISWKVDDLIKNYYEPVMMDSYGMGLADMLSLQGMSLDAFREENRTTAEENVRQLLVMDAIAEAEGITVTDAEIEGFAERNGTTVESMKETASDEEIEAVVREDLATQVVIDNAKVTYKEAESE